MATAALLFLLLQSFHDACDCFSALSHVPVLCALSITISGIAFLKSRINTSHLEVMPESLFDLFSFLQRFSTLNKTRKEGYGS